MATTPKLGVRLMASNDVQKEVVFNEATIVFDTMVARTALARQNNPPTNPAASACYVVATAPTGAWVGRENQIALFFNGWRFYTPTQKMKFFLESTSTYWTFSGSAWTQDPAGSPSTLDDLTNVGGAAPQDGQVLTFNEGSGIWEPSTLPSQSPLVDLPDVDFSDLVDGQMIAWDETNEVWKNVMPPSGGGGGAQNLADLNDVEMAGVTDGYLLTWNDGKAQFLKYEFPARQLNDLTDVNSAGAQQNDVLAWNGAAWGPSPAVITYSFLGMVDGPQTMTGYAGHFLVVDPTESELEFRSLQDLIDNLDNFRMQDLTDLMTAADEHVGKVVTLAKTGENFRYTYTTLPSWAVVFNDGETELTDRIRSLTFHGFDVSEGEDGHIVVTAQNALDFEAEGVPYEDPVNAINFIGNGVNITLIEGTLTVDFEIPPPAVELGALEDVDLETISPIDGHVLRFDGVSGKWMPGEGGIGGGVVDGEVEPALYELGPFAPPTAAMFPLRTNAPSADLTLIKNRGLFVQPGPQSSGVRHGVVARNIGEQDVPWQVTARIVPSSFPVAGHMAGIVVQRAFNGSFIFLALGNSNSDTQHQLRLGWIGPTGTETILLTEPNYYPWLRLAFDGDNVRAYVSAEGLIWHPFGNPVNPGTTLAGTPDRVGITNRSNATHDGSVGALVTYWDDPEFPAAARIQQGVVALSVGGLQDVDLETTAPTDGQTIVWNAAGEKWVPGDASGGGSVIESLGDINDVDLETPPEDGQALVWDEVASCWVPGQGAPEALGDIGDVDMSETPQDGNSLVYDALTGKWVPGTAFGNVASEFGISLFFSGEPDPETVVVRYVASREYVLPAHLGYSYAYAETPPDGTVVFDVQKNGTSIGSLEFSYGEPEGVFTFSEEVAFVRGDRLTFIAPFLTHSIKDIAITISGRRQ